MISFYGGPKGQDLLVSEIFDSCDSMLKDLVTVSEVEIGQLIAISYNNFKIANGYYSNREKDEGYTGYYNGSFWQKEKRDWTNEYKTENSCIYTDIYVSISEGQKVRVVSISKEGNPYPFVYFEPNTGLGYERKLDLGTLPIFEVQTAELDGVTAVPAVQVEYKENDKTQHAVLKFEFPDLIFEESTGTKWEGQKDGDYIFETDTGVFYKVVGGTKEPQGSLVIKPKIDVTTVNPYDNNGIPVEPAVEINASTNPWTLVFKTPKAPRISLEINDSTGIAKSSAVYSQDGVTLNLDLALDNLAALQLKPNYGYNYKLAEGETFDEATTLPKITEELDGIYGDLPLGTIVALYVSAGDQFYTYWALRAVINGKIGWQYLKINSFQTETFTWQKIGPNNSTGLKLIYDGGRITDEGGTV